MPSETRGREPAQLRELRAELRGNPALADLILATLRMVPEEPERVLRCSGENAERAVCRALALADVRREVWRVEILEGEG
jgi:hypothetical protein